MDTDLFRFYVLAHDPSSGVSDKQAQTIFRKMKEVFGASYCRLLHINSYTGNVEAAPHQKPPPAYTWSHMLPRFDAYKIEKRQRMEKQKNQQQQQQQHSGNTPDSSNVANNGPNTGAENDCEKLMTMQDIEYISIMVDELVSNGVVPHLERKIKHINNTIVQSKKGFKYKLSSWLSKKPTKEESSTSGGSTEMQIRRMADYAFMLRDYDTALSCYKLISSDFKSNKSYKHYAGTLEFAAYSMLMNSSMTPTTPPSPAGNSGAMSGGNAGTSSSDAVRRESDSMLDTAYANYRAMKQPALCQRVALMQAAISKTRFDFRKAAESFIRATSVDDTNFFKSALLFEQTAFCFLMMSPAMFRKYAFFMILSGYRYSHSSQYLHSFRCYRSALNLYYHREWDQIFEHVTITMGRLSNFMGSEKDAVTFMHDFMCNCTQLPDHQKAYMNEFLSTVNHYLKKKEQSADERKSNEADEFSFLELPSFNMASAKVLLNMYGTPTATDDIPSSRWKYIEERLVGHVRGPNHAFRWDNLNSPKDINSKQLYCVVGEPIFVEVEVKNPLFIPIDFSIYLDATFTPEVAELTEVNQSEDGAHHQKEQPFIAEKINVQLQAGRREKVRLRIDPFTMGDLRIHGIVWTLADVITGKRSFDLKGRRLNETKNQRISVMHQEDRRMHIKIIAEMPRIEMELIDLPSHMWTGELKKCVLEIKNVGKLAMSNLYLKTSHPNLIEIGPPSKLDVPIFEMQELDLSSSSSRSSKLVATPSSEFITDLSLFKLPVAQIAPGQSIKLPVFVRGGKAATYNLLCMAYYEPVLSDAHDSEPSTLSTLMPYRLYQMSNTIRVTESVQIKYFSQPRSKANDGGMDFLLGVQVTNKRAKQSIVLKQLTSVSSRWVLQPINFQQSKEQTDDHLFTIPPNESTTLYFDLREDESYRNVPIDKDAHLNVRNMEDKDIQRLTELIHSQHLLDMRSPLQQCTVEKGLNGDDQNGSKLLINTTTTPQINFLFRACPSYIKATEVFHEQQKEELYAEDNSRSQLDLSRMVKPLPPKRNFVFLAQHGLALMLHWFSPEQQQIGQSLVKHVKFLPFDGQTVSKHVASSFPAQDNLSSPVRVVLQYDREVTHDFVRDGPMCTAMVNFQLTNISPDRTCDFTLELLTPTELPRSLVVNEIRSRSNSNTPAFDTLAMIRSRKIRNISQPFMWVGTTRMHLLGLRPSETVNIPVCACFFASGSYNLHEFRLFWKDSPYVPGVSSSTQTPQPLDQRQPIESAVPPTMITFQDMQYMMAVINTAAAEEITPA